MADGVLGLGDSITAGPDEDAFGVAPRPWAQWLAETLDLPFHRLARPGATTPQIAAELLPRAHEHYALACVHVGTNDVRAPSFTLGPFAEALAEILNVLGPRADRVCVATIPLDLGRPRAGAKVAALNAAIRELATEHGGTVVALDDLRGWRHLLPDAVHPTAYGQLEIARRAAGSLGIAADTLPEPRRGPRADLRHLATREAVSRARDAARRLRER
jgi:lysophospholipase L1-like esterase